MGKMNHLVCLLVIDMEYFLATMPCAWKLFFFFRWCSSMTGLLDWNDCVTITLKS
jgi:hypothetical protein